MNREVGPVLMVAVKFPPYFAGAAVQATYLAGCLKRFGVSVEFVTDNENRASERSLYHGIPVHRLRTFFKDSSKLKQLVYIARIGWFALTHPRYRIVHFHSMRGFEALLFPLLKLMGRRILLKLTLVGYDDPLAMQERRMGRLFRWGIGFVDHFVVISTELYKRTIAAGIPGDKVSLISNGVDTGLFCKAEPQRKRSLRRALGLPETAKVFLSVGKVEARKGYDFLLRAWRRIQDWYPGGILVIAGPANDEENAFYRHLRTLMEEQGIERVVFAGQIDNVQDYMRAADCFLFCSIQEGFGTVLIEAMASGVPVIARNIENVTADIIKEPALGRIYSGASPEDFADTVLNFLIDWEPAKADESVERVRQEFSLTDVARRYLRLYGEMEGRESQSRGEVHYASR